jgi:tetratricopeptide (TPR) repeat protein
MISIIVASKADNFIKNSQANLEKQLDSLCLAYDRGEHADVEKRLGSLLDITRAHLGIEHQTYMLCRHVYLMNLVELGDYTKALGVLEETIADYASLPIDISSLIPRLAKILMHTGRSIEAEALLRKLLGSEASLKRIDEMPSPAVNIRSMHPETNEALALFLAQPSRSDLDLKDRVETLHLLAEALILQGRYEEAEELLDRALELTGELPLENPEQWRARTTLGRALRLQGRRREARAVLESASARAKAGVGESHADYALILEELARIKQPTEAATAATG